jgi:hypothetical protein
MITINEDLFKLRISKWHVSFQGNYSEQRKLVEIGESIDKGEDDAPQNIITEKGIGRITMGDCQYQLKRGNLSFFH